jgi:type III secretory pathway component EscV
MLAFSSFICCAAGQIDADELAAVVERITEKQSTIRHMRMIIAALVRQWVWSQASGA